MAQFMNQNSVAVTGLDLRGHGHSNGKKGHVKNFDLLLSDVEELLKFTRAEYLEAPLILFGHSLGGNIVANFVKTEKTSELSGFILSAPFLKVNFNPPKWKTYLAQMLSSIWPSLTQSTDLEVSALSRIPEEVQKYVDDPMVHDLISVELYLSSIKMGESVVSNPKELELPGLIYHGTDDRLTSQLASKEFSEHNRKNVQFIALEGAYHEPHNDLCRDEVYDKILDFIRE